MFFGKKWVAIKSYPWFYKTVINCNSDIRGSLKIESDSFGITSFRLVRR